LKQDTGIQQNAHQKEKTLDGVTGGVGSADMSGQFTREDE